MPFNMRLLSNERRFVSSPAIKDSAVIAFLVVSVVKSLTHDAPLERNITGGVPDVDDFVHGPGQRTVVNDDVLPGHTQCPVDFVWGITGARSEIEDTERSCWSHLAQ